MKWPDHADYAEVVQNPELCFELPELHTGAVATTPLGLPRALSGNFATVYEVAGGGQTFAVRCFVRQVTNQQDRYAALERHFEAQELPCLVPFEFVSRGIRVHERWFPIVKMNWVAGAPLHVHVEQQLRTPEKLAWLAADWREMMAGLKHQRIGHGDLQHGNVLVTPEGELKLVDYDGMYVPLFARERSPELGHANYQHPLRSPEFYDERLDHFPELLIYLSLRALAAEPALWDEFFNGDNLLVTAVDLRVPHCSSLWPRLLKSPDRDVRRLTVVLVDCLRKAPIDVPSLETVLKDQLSQVVVPDQLDLTAPVNPVGAGTGGPVPVSEADTEVEAFGRRLDGPLAAMNIERTPGGSRSAPPAPRLVDVLAWSAVATALIALVPPFRSVAGLAAAGLGLLAWLMPGHRLQRARVAAALAAMLGIACVYIGNDVHVAARPTAGETRVPLPVAERAETAEQVVVRSELTPVGPPALTQAVPLTTAPASAAQPVSRPLTAPVQFPLATVQHRWKPHGETVATVLVSVDQKHVLSAATDRTLAMWHLGRRQSVFTRTNLAEPLITLTALTNIGIVAAVDAMHQLQWWSLDGGLPLKTVPLDPDALVPPRISPNGHIIAAGGSDRRQVVLLFDAAPAGSQTLAALSSWAKLVRFSPDSERVALACLDDTISLRRVDSGAVLRSLNFHDAAIGEVEFSPDGSRLLALGEQGALRIWNCDNGSVMGEARLPLQHPVVAWLEGGHGVKVVVAAGRRLLLLGPAPGLTIDAELSAPSEVTTVTALPDGTGFITGHSNGELALWSLNRRGTGGAMKLARP